MSRKALEACLKALRAFRGIGDEDVNRAIALAEAALAPPPLRVNRDPSWRYQVRVLFQDGDGGLECACDTLDEARARVEELEVRERGCQWRIYDTLEKRWVQ